MPYCPNCGAEIPEGVRYCPSCGVELLPAVGGVCPNCGTSISPQARFCPNCGSPVGAAPKSRPTPTPTPISLPPERPIGVAIVSALLIVNAVLNLATEGFGFGSTASGVVALLISLALSWGLWTGKGWAWTVTRILAALGLIGGLGMITLWILLGPPGLMWPTKAMRLLSSLVISVIFTIVVLWYLHRDEVKRYFGKL